MCVTDCGPKDGLASCHMPPASGLIHLLQGRDLDPIDRLGEATLSAVSARESPKYSPRSHSPMHQATLVSVTMATPTMSYDCST